MIPGEGPTKIKNAMQLNLSIDVDSLDPELLKMLAFRISMRIKDQKRDFELTNIYLSFVDKNGNENRDWQNFGLGINVITGYFKQPTKTSPDNFYQWVEDQFMLSEDDNWLMENEAWTTLSEKSRP
ncbi:hypothetical protein [Cohnella abietis]|uniref:Uncharacterized protein n=1 Tax=Cohnella abietis TaxID=2507935 RepID=A0A3T1CY86_9BACL|nr:hypothetical protein [Cohnella abietis]BBI30771.1 hypothetical protein KCTCHS21_01700 [Cohnella abietis]